MRLQHGAHSTASRLLQTSTWRERGTLPNPPQRSPQHNPVVLPLVSTHAKLRSGSVSESFHFYCRMFTGEHWLQAHCVFSKEKKKEKRWSLVIIRPTLLFGCFSSFVPTAPPTYPQPHPATSSHPRLLLPSSGIVNVWVLPRHRRLVGSLTAHRCCIKHRHANNSFLTVEWK